MKNNQEKIIEYLKEKGNPISIKELAEYLGTTQRSTTIIIRDLQEKGIVAKVGSARYSMWCLSENNGGITNDELINIKSVFNDNIANSKGASEELQCKIDEVEDKINKIYINLISIMGIFVTVFSLIVSNAQRIYDVSQIGFNSSDLIKSVLVSNVSTVAVIFFLLLFIKCFFGVKKK